jgi:hypothetical protein
MKEAEFYTIINKYVNFFLSSYGDEDIVKKWKDKKNQENFNSMTLNLLNKIHQFKDMQNIYKHNMDNQIKDTKRKSKASKVEGAPKKNLSGYLLFCQHERQNIYNENKNSETPISNKDIVSVMAKRWKALSESDPVRHQRYVDLAIEDKQRYSAEKLSWKEQNSSESVPEEQQPVPEPVVVEQPVPESKKAPKKRVSKKKEEEVVVEEEVLVEDDTPVVEAPVPDTKKKGGNKYINFCNKMRDTVKTEKPGITFKDVSVELGRRWKSLTSEEQNKFA